MKSSSELFKRLSYRDLVEIMSERGISIAHTTIMRWVHQFASEIAKKVRPHLKLVNDSWRVDETYIKVKGQWKLPLSCGRFDRQNH